MGMLGQLFSKFSKGPAIQQLENIDMVVQMKDGGIILPIVCHKHLDGSDEVLELLRTKVSTYVMSIETEAFRNEFPRRDYFIIELNCLKKPEPRVLDELDSLEKEYRGKGIRFSWKT